MNFKRAIRLWACLAGLGVVLVVAIVVIRASLPAAAPIAPGALQPLLDRADELSIAARADTDVSNPVAPNLDSRAKFKQAKALLVRARADYPDNPRVYVALAKLEIDKSILFDISTTEPSTRYPTSIKRLLDKALSLDPRCADALLWLARYHELRNENDAALAVDEMGMKVTSAPNLQADHMQFELHASRILVRLGKLDEVERRMLSLIKRSRDADNSGVLHIAQELLAEVYLKRKKYKDAERLLVKAVKEAAGTEMAACPYQALGAFYIALGQNEKGIKIATRAADIDSHKADVQTFAAHLAFENGHYDLALKYMRRALALQPNSEPYKKERATILAAAKPRPPAVEFKQALAYFDDHKFRRAMIHINRALARKQSADFKVVKGYLLLLEKKYKKAEALFRQVRNANKTAAGAAVGLGHLHIANKDYAGARRLLEQAAGEDSPKAEGMNAKASPYAYLVHRMACIGMGWLLANQGKHHEAVVYFDRALPRCQDSCRLC